MAEYLKNNPVALRHCLLYEYLQRNPYKRAFTNIRDTIGSDVFTEEELRSFFSQFRKRKMDGNDRRIKDMRDVLRNDKHALRACILYESLKYKMAKSGYKTFYLWPRSPLFSSEILLNPSFSLYNNFCKKLGDDAMEYREFDFWFYRFFNGEFDLNYEREKNEKIYELTNMPLDVMENVVEYLDIIDRKSLEGTSQSLRSFSQNQKQFHDHLEFKNYWDSLSINLNEFVHISYSDQGNDCLMEFRNSEKVLRGVSSIKQGFQDFKKILENPKLHLHNLTVQFWRDDPDSLRGIEDALKLTHMLHVQRLGYFSKSSKALMDILPLLTPGYLTTITVNISLDEATIGKKVEMEQWKQAKYLDMGIREFIGPLHLLYHFKEFTLRREKLLFDDFREMKEILLKSPAFEKCKLSCSNRDNPRRVFGEPIEGSIDTWHYPIPDSTEYFEIVFKREDVNIERKKK